MFLVIAFRHTNLSEPLYTAANAGSLSPETAAPLKTELAAISTTYLNLSMPSWGQTLPAPAAYLPIGPQPILGHVAYNYTEGLFCPTSPSALKNQLTAIPSPPVAEEKRNTQVMVESYQKIRFGHEAGNGGYSQGLA